MTTATPTDERTAFLVALHNGCDGVYELRALPSKARLFAPIGRPERADAFAQRYVSENLYIAVATRRDDASGKLENCQHLGAVFVDVDFKVTPEPAARARLAQFPFSPSAVVRSGGGLHVYWFLREPLDLTADGERLHAKQLLRRLAGTLGADLAAAEPARVLRLPGTFNHKPEYGAARPVVLESLEPGRRLDPTRLDEALAREQQHGAVAVGPFMLPDRIPAHTPGRNATLWRYGRSLKAKGWQHTQILAELTRVNAERCEPPLAAAELAEIVRNVVTETDRPEFAAGRNGNTSGTRDAISRPVIPISGDLVAMTSAAWDALLAANAPPVLFRRGAGLPVRLEHAAGVTMTRLLNHDRMRHALARASRWERVEQTREGQRYLEVLPPVAVVADLLATPAPPLPELDRIVTVPTFTPSGRLRLTPGYDRDGCAYFAPPPDLTVPAIPEQPSASDLDGAARLLLDEYLGEFPFVGPAERAHALSLLLLPFLRELVEGPTPLYLVEAPTPGTGKTLLVDLLLWPALGHPAPKMAEGRDEDEWRKRITAKLLASAPAVCLDNLRRPLDSSAVASAVTATLYEDRILGRSETEAVPVRCLWAATGNNPRLSLEMARRTVRIRLDARTEEPWLRTGFRTPDIYAWAREHRGRLIAAALTLGQGWIVAGRPGAKTPTLGMFESWTRVLAGVLSVAGVDGFLSNLSQFYEDADLDGAEIRAFLAAWWLAHRDAPVKTADLLTLDALPGRVTDGGHGAEDRGRSTRLGKLLSSLRDRPFRLECEGSVRVSHAGVSHSAARWRLTRAT